MNIDQLNYYQRKLAYEIDAWDLETSLTQAENIIVVDGRSQEAYTLEHIPNAINLCHKDIDLCCQQWRKTLGRFYQAA